MDCTEETQGQDLDQELDLNPAPELGLVEHLNKMEQGSRANVPVASRSFVREFLKKEKVAPDEDLLEIGCGTGYLNSLMPRKFRNKILQTDPSAEALEEAQKRNPDGQYKQLDSRNMSEIPDGSIDRVFAMNVLNYMPLTDVERTILEVRRVLRQGGKCYSLTDLQPNKDTVWPHMAQKKGIPPEFVSISELFRYGCLAIRVSDSREEKEGSSIWTAFAEMMGTPQEYEDTGIYFTNEILHPLFKKHFGKAEYLPMMAGAAPQHRVLAQYFPLIVTNGNLAAIAEIDARIEGSKIRKLTSKLLIDPQEIRAHILGRLRKLEVVGMYLNKGEK
jgi:SAM-dependent methyltransferase